MVWGKAIGIVQGSWVEIQNGDYSPFFLFFCFFWGICKLGRQFYGRIIVGIRAQQKRCLFFARHLYNYGAPISYSLIINAAA
jgi:hypothetical protein